MYNEIRKWVIMMISVQLRREIIKWIDEYEKENTVEYENRIKIDTGTLEGRAYSLLAVIVETDDAD